MRQTEEQVSKGGPEKVSGGGSWTLYKSQAYAGNTSSGSITLWPRKVPASH